MNRRPVALVTGGSRRVGRAISMEMARRGCDVVLTWRTSGDEAASVAEAVRALGGRAWCVRLDLASSESVEGVVGRLPDEVGAIDILVHNAAVFERTPLGSFDRDHVARMLQVNAIAPLHLTAVLLGRLRASELGGGGSVVAMADIHAMGRPRSGFAPYSMSKAALVEMVRSLAVELAPDIRVNGVAPGVVAWPDEGYESDEASREAYLERVPLGRSGEPEDAAGAVTWLALDATYVTGQVVRVDGGRWLR